MRQVSRMRLSYRARSHETSPVDRARTAMVIELKDLLRLIRIAFLSQQVTHIAIGFGRGHRGWIEPFFPGKQIFYLGGSSRLSALAYWFLNRRFIGSLISYGYNSPAHLLAKHRALKSLHVFEDGFFRGTRLPGPSSAEAPLSACVDSVGLHFDSNQITELDRLLNGTDWSEPQWAAVLRAADDMILTCRSTGFSKFQSPSGAKTASQSTSRNRTTIVVLGQVPSDQSLVWGANLGPDFFGLAELARLENPGAQILFRPHPKAKPGPVFSKSMEATGVSISRAETNLTDDLRRASRVYALTSQAGFDALLAGVPVTVFGTPFYAGWGLTDDRALWKPGKRNRTILLRELVAGAIFLYPKYLDRERKRLVDGVVALADWGPLKK